ncbi:phage integrase family protein [Candidatus Nitrososphaera evergladensis SR1]|uniref:Phage integrase family protein n=1 Tax=Candidatus Nitrososphaera evergladensis SR1 TaxID=1459636 RepID=A0A075MS30_9ARCH|nr:site-specific integrase [Candidatus Nitrososphaera evergladensis]AIF83915.1 phage integrase family protein [Candidatus Nitrososphaera evergladensis SR1]
MALIVEAKGAYQRFLSKTRNDFTRRQYDHFLTTFIEFTLKVKVDSPKLQELKKEFTKNRHKEKATKEALKKSILEEKIRIMEPLVAQITELPITSLEDLIIDFINYLSGIGRGYGSQIAVVNAMRKFCKANKIVLDFDGLREAVGEDDTERDDKPYSKDMVQRVMQAADLRKQTIIGILASCGMRRGGLADLKLKHLTKLSVDNWPTVYALKVYPNSARSCYTTFVTPEVTAIIDQYLESRRAAGETLNEESPLLREQFAIESADNPRHITTGTIAQLVHQVIEDAGLKGELRKNKIHEMHGFRKHVYTELIKAGVKDINVKRIVGHSTGLGKNYDRQELEDVLRDYMKALPALTISDAPVLRAELEKMKIQNADIDILKIKVSQQADDLRVMQSILERYAKGEIQQPPKRSPEEERDYLEWLLRDYEKEHGGSS